MQYWMKNSSSVTAPYTRDDWKSERGALWPTVNFPRTKRPSARRGDRMFWHAVGSAAWLGDGAFFALGEVTSAEPMLTDHEQWHRQHGFAEAFVITNDEFVRQAHGVPLHAFLLACTSELPDPARSGQIRDGPDAVGVIEKCPNGRVSGEQSPSEGGGTASLSQRGHERVPP